MRVRFNCIMRKRALSANCRAEQCNNKRDRSPCTSRMLTRRNCGSGRQRRNILLLFLFSLSLFSLSLSLSLSLLTVIYLSYKYASPRSDFTDSRGALASPGARARARRVRLFNGKQNASQTRRRARSVLDIDYAIIRGRQFSSSSFFPSLYSFLASRATVGARMAARERLSIPFVGRLPAIYLARIIPFDRTCHRKPRNSHVPRGLPTPPLNPYPFPLPLPPVSIRVAASESVRSIAEMTRSEPEAALHGNRCVQGHDSRTFLAIFPRSGRPVHASIYPLLHRSLAGTGPEIHDKAASTHSRGYARDREERACG